MAIIVVAAVSVLLVLAGGAAAWWRWDGDRQPRVEDAVAVMTRAVADAVVAAGPTAAVAVSGVLRSTECRINAFRQGGIFTANADVYTDPGGEEALITAMAEPLSRSYPIRRGAAVAGVRPASADLPAGVRLSIRRLSAGWLSVSARTGCSLGSAPASVEEPVDPTAREAITAVFAALGTRPTSFKAHRLPCAQGSTVTVAAVSEPADSAGLRARLAATIPAQAHRLAAGTSNRVAYRAGTVSVIVAASDDGTSVTSQYTVVC